MRNKTRKLVILLCCIICCLGLMGCEGTSGNKSVIVNQFRSEVILSHVNFYDFFNSVSVSDYSGTCYVPIGKFDSTEIVLLDATGVTRIACVSKSLLDRPATVDVYTNAEKTTYDTYTCTY